MILSEIASQLLTGVGGGLVMLRVSVAGGHSVVEVCRRGRRPSPPSVASLMV